MVELIEFKPNSNSVEDYIYNVYQDIDHKEAKAFIETFNKQYKVYYIDHETSFNIFYVQDDHVIDLHIYKAPIDIEAQFSMYYVLEAISLNAQFSELEVPSQIEKYFNDFRQKVVNFFDDDTLMFLGVDCF